MKLPLLLLALCTLALPSFGQDLKPPQALDVMTFNLRYAHTTPPNLWPDRRPVMRALVERWAPDVFGTQEGLYTQLTDLARDLPAYAWIGLGRDGGSRGEFMAVFYRKDRLAPVAFDHFWLSDTPELIGSHTWGNSFPRMVTWVRFRDQRTEEEFYLVNTHFDHQSQPARERSAALLLERVRQLDPEVPVVLTGDFNVAAGRNPVYDTLTVPGAFTDAWRQLGLAEPPYGTFHDFKGPEGAKGEGRIDWILLRGKVTPLSEEVITYAREGQYPSDHFPVLARVLVGAQ